ncbi:MAG: GNAT family N-acetyltransferase [Actinomycetia bacterium]|nr:GNAT family N-acetyltransferase [Actinomycetes bacterium]
MSQQEQIATFLDQLTHHDGFAPLSAEKLPVDPATGRAVLIAEDGVVMALGAVASHTHNDGSKHWALETAVQPGMRFPTFEAAVLDASFALVGTAEPLSVWSRRSSLDSALTGMGFVANRTLVFLVVQLPLDAGPAPTKNHRIRSFSDGDVADIVAVNRTAFEDHREAGALDIKEMSRYQSEPWFDDAGIFIAEDESGRTVGFCWTKVHPNGDGEIFRIAVDPRYQGRGLGVALLGAGFSYLSGRSDVLKGVLWVDKANTAAMQLYRSIGMTRDGSNREFSLG